MKLILASDLSFLLKYGYKLIGIPKEEIRIGYINTAAKVSRNNKDFFIAIKDKIKKDGYVFDEIDIEGKSKEEIITFFNDKNVIQVGGGNTFYLLKIIRETKFGEILKELLGDNKVYIGESAGSYVICPTIEVANWNDDGKDRFGINDFTALNYVPFVLKVHYKDDQEGKIKEKISSLKYPIYILRDGQGIIVDNGNYNFVGDGNEVKL